MSILLNHKVILRAYNFWRLSLTVEAWKRKLRAIGFVGSIDSWPDSQGNDLSVEAIPDARHLEPVQIVFKAGPNDSRTARELLREFSVCLVAVYREAQSQVLTEAVLHYNRNRV